MALVRGLVEGARVRRRLPEAWLAHAGIAPQLLEQEGARISTEQYIRLLRVLISRLEDEALGLLSRPLKRGSLELLARSAVQEPDLAAALRRVCHVLDLLQDDLELALAVDGTLAGVTVGMACAEWRPRFLHELMVRIAWRLSAWLAGGSLPALRFDFAFEEPPYAAQYGPTFPAPMRFGQPHSAFWFDARRLTRPVLRDGASLHAFVASWPAALIVPRRGKSGIAERVRAHLLQHRPRWPGLEDTACALHMSVPTLQRQLAGAGTSFQVLKDELRRDIAIARLTVSRESLAEIGAALGFAESAAFQRAFKRWTGSPPGAYRTR